MRKSYGKIEALKGVSLSIAPGEIVGLLGPNGAGKSTLFQIAAGLFAPDGGEVRLFGHDYRDHSLEILRRLGVVFQSRSVDLDMTVFANLPSTAISSASTGKLLRDRIAEATELLEITDLVEQPVRTLSGGNQRRVEIARALLNAPELLLMDEPTVGLDPTMRQLVATHMQKVREHQGYLDPVGDPSRRGGRRRRPHRGDAGRGTPARGFAGRAMRRNGSHRPDGRLCCADRRAGHRQLTSRIPSNFISLRYSSRQNSTRRR